MDVNRMTTGEKVAGASGVALILIMFIFSWFSVETGLGGTNAGFNAWQAFGLIDIVLFLAACAAIALALVAATQTQVNAPVALSAVTAGLGILSVVLIVFRIISTPDIEVLGFSVSDAGVDVGRSIGVFLGLIAAGGVAFGGWTAMQDEGTSFGDQADRVGGGGTGGTPPPPPPPPAGGAPPPAGGAPPPAGGGPAA